MIVDAESGEAYLRPAPRRGRRRSRRASAVRAERRAEFARLRDTPAFTRDGAKITLLMNAGLAVDLDILAETGAEGIGLFRTEFQFMVSEELPRFNAQTALYARVLDAAGDLPVTFRTLDLGGDKVLPYLEAEREDNPALGWRAIRMGLDRPALLRLQLRALIAAARGPAAAGHVPAGRQRRRVPRRPRAGRPGGRLGRSAAAARRPSRLRRRRDDRGAVADLAPGRAAADDRLRLGRHQRPDAVPVRRRPRQSAGRRPLRPALAAGAAGAEDASRRPAPRPARRCRCAARWPAGRWRPSPWSRWASSALSMPPAGIGPVKQMVLSCDREAARRGVEALAEGDAGLGAQRSRDPGAKALRRSVNYWLRHWNYAV